MAQLRHLLPDRWQCFQWHAPRRQPIVGEIQRKRSEQNQGFVVGNWAAVENPETGRAIVIVSGERAQQLEIHDADKKGGYFYLSNSQNLLPNGEHEMVIYMALAGSVDEAKCYAALTALAKSDKEENQK